MIGIELTARRAALGLSQGRLAGVLGVAQNTVSTWEKGTRGIPDGIDAELGRLEEARDVLVERMLDGLADAEPDTALIVHRSDETWWHAHPENAGLPHEVQVVAAALASCEAEPRPAIVAYPDV